MHNVNAIAKAMWESSHLGSWEDGAGGSVKTTEYDRQTYRDHARVAIETIARLAASTPGVEGGSDLTNERWRQAVANAPKPDGPLTPIRVAVERGEVARDRLRRAILPVVMEGRRNNTAPVETTDFILSIISSDGGGR